MTYDDSDGLGKIRQIDKLIRMGLKIQSANLDFS